MLEVLQRRRAALRGSVERSRHLEDRMKQISKAIWPWRMSWLFPLVALLAALDLISTYALLELSGKTDVYEGGLLAKRALRFGGWNGLYVMNAGAVGFLSIVAVSARFFYGRFGLDGFARTAYVSVLVPYAVAASAAVVNNVVMTFI